MGSRLVQPRWLASPHRPGGLARSTWKWKTAFKGLDFLQVSSLPGGLTLKRFIFGMNFPCVQPSAWATKHGLAGRSLEDIKLHELLWQGWQNCSLRALAQGRCVSIKFTRSIKEAAFFVSYFLQHLREQKVDLDQVAEFFCVESGTQLPQISENSKKAFRMKELAQFVTKQLQPDQTQELAGAQDRNRDLERQLAQQRKRTHDEADVGTEPLPARSVRRYRF